MWGLVILQLVFGLLKPASVEVKTNPSVCLSPCRHLTVTVRVEPNDLNRYVDVAVNGEDYYRSSAFQLDGASAPKTLPPFEFKDIPAGEYEVSATIYGAGDAVLARRVVRFEVKGETVGGKKKPSQSCLSS